MSGDEQHDFDVYDVEYEPEGLSSDDEPRLKKEEENSDESDLDEAIIGKSQLYMSLLSLIHI